MQTQKISFLGDVFLDRPYNIDVDLGEIVLNFEYPITNATLPSKGKVNLKCGESFLVQTFKKKPLAACIANNHIFDYGHKGFEDTLKFLDKENINYFGGGLHQERSLTKTILGNHKIGIQGYCCETTNAIYSIKGKNGSINKIEKDSILRDIKRYKEEVDFLVLQLHWGMEEIPYVKSEDRILAHGFIDAGADLIIGHHAHVAQEVEVYKGKHIFYGLGNFIFPDLNLPSNFDGERFTNIYVKKQHSWNRTSIVVELDTDLNVAFFAVRQRGNKVKQSKYKSIKPRTEGKRYEQIVKRIRKERKLKKFMEAPLFYFFKKIRR